MLLPIEANYPITFRRPYATKLGQYLMENQSVALIGIKRVGIANFLRFFLHHPDIKKSYLKDKPHFFIEVSLQDLVTISEYAFWKLMAKRLVDTILDSNLPDVSKKRAKQAFTEILQLEDPMVTLDNIKQMLQEIVNSGLIPSIFIVNFDRLKPIFTAELFNNLEGIRYATHDRLSFVITAYRPLTQLTPPGLPASSLKLFARELYIPPIIDPCAYTIFETYQKRFQVDLSDELKKQLVKLCGGHVQYLQLAVTLLKNLDAPPKNSEDLFTLLTQSEEMTLQSEEIFNSLSTEDQKLLTAIVKQKNPNRSLLKQHRYLLETKLITESMQLNNPILAHYIDSTLHTKTQKPDLTKKENTLFQLLLKHKDEVVERDHITEVVWPDQIEIGVSDWAIDRLIARLRKKLSDRRSKFQIETVVTRGYKLVSSP